MPMSADPDPARMREHDQHQEHETDPRADPDQSRHASRDAPDHLLTARAERHADANLTRAPRDREGDDRIEPDAGEHQTEAAKGTEECGDPIRYRQRARQLLRHRLRRHHRQLMSTARSSRCIAATSGAASPDVRATTVVGSAPDWSVRGIEQRRDRIEDVVVEVSRARVAHDTDHLRPRVGIVDRPESPADRVHRAEVLPRHSLR